MPAFRLYFLRFKVLDLLVESCSLKFLVGNQMNVEFWSTREQGQKLDFRGYHEGGGWWSDLLRMNQAPAP